MEKISLDEILSQISSGSDDNWWWGLIDLENGHKLLFIKFRKPGELAVRETYKVVVESRHSEYDILKLVSVLINMVWETMTLGALTYKGKRFYEALYSLQHYDMV